MTDQTKAFTKFLTSLKPLPLEHAYFIGVGTDICKVERMKTLVHKWGARFPARILSSEELGHWHQNAKSLTYLAKRWAGKEALVKSLGTGFAKGLRWREISVLNDDQGKPFVQLSGQTAVLLQQQRNIQFFISLADEAEFALAFAAAFEVSE